MHRATRVSSRWVAIAAALAAGQAARADVTLEIGINATRVAADVATLAKTESTSTGLHLGAGVSRALRQGSIGVRAELDDVDGDRLLALRALDYEHRLSERLSIGGFFGAARLDLATPAYGYYLGGGVRLRKLFADWDLGVDLRLGDKIARDNLLPSDPQGGRPDNFYDLKGVSVYLGRRF
jgi:hypothetical protein